MRFSPRIAFKYVYMHIYIHIYACIHIYIYIYIPNLKKNLKATTFLIPRIFGKGPTACIMGLEVLLLKMILCNLWQMRE